MDLIKAAKKKQTDSRNGILLQKLFIPTVRINCSSDRRKLLKFEAEDQKFAKNYESLLWQYRLWSFQERDTKLERVLAKNQMWQAFKKWQNLTFKVNVLCQKSSESF